MEQIRSFIAIELPPEVIQALTGLQEKLKAGGRQVKWVEPGNIHLTLQFLGNIDTVITGKITTAIEHAVSGVHPFPIEVGGLGVFPNIQRVQIIWVGLTGEIEKLAYLQQSIGENLQPLGFTPETRPFTPHLTLGRVRDYCRPEERAALGKLVEKAVLNTKYKVNVSSVNLMKSQLTREGPIYSIISSVILK
jgi:2'-5' RNA ligase